jgi:hydroxyacylglutathione hydrolase
LFFRQLLNDESACASYLLGCKSRGQLAVVDPHVDLVDEYVALADAQGVPIVAVFETHVQADHVSGLPELTARTGAAAYLPAGAGVEFDHHPLRDGEVVHLGNTEFQAIATPGHAQAHHAYLVTDHARADDPWMVLTGDALLVGDAGRPDLHAASTIGFERRHNQALQHDSEEAFVESLIHDIPPAPERQAEIVTANRAGRPVPSSTAV